MFESDDYDLILSQVDFTELCAPNPLIQKPNVQVNSQKNTVERSNAELNISPLVFKQTIKPETLENCNKTNKNVCEISKNNSVNKYNSASPKHDKRKMINSYFDHKSKRKFPGPAGLLLNNFEEKKDDDICHLELLSQDIDFTQSYLHCNVFESPLWKRLLEDTASLRVINSISSIKNQALAGNLLRRKAEFVTAVVESIDRSAIDPLITLRDETGNIKCTLHRDAWTAFSPYIASEFCALVLCKPTVLTTGSAFKKHYLNITLGNISIMYSSTVANENETLPDGYQKTCEEDYTIIRMDRSDNFCSNETIQNSLDYLEDLDSAFADEIF